MTDGDHPPEDVLEDYARGAIRGEAAITIRDHIRRCSECRRSVQETRDFIDTLRLYEGESDVRPLHHLHDTLGGDVEVFVVAEAEGWTAAVVGPSIDFKVGADSVTEANARAKQAFSELFPEHRCVERCGPF